MFEMWLIPLMLLSALAGLGTGYGISWVREREAKRCIRETLGGALGSAVKQWTRHQTRADRYSELCQRVAQWKGSATSFEALRDEIRFTLRREWHGPDLDEKGRIS